MLRLLSDYVRDVDLFGLLTENGIGSRFPLVLGVGPGNDHGFYLPVGSGGTICLPIRTFLDDRTDLPDDQRHFQWTTPTMLYHEAAHHDDVRRAAFGCDDFSDVYYSNAIIEAFEGEGLLDAIEFKRGDANQDGRPDTTDALWSLELQFLGSVRVDCLDALDFDDSGIVDVNDLIVLPGFFFLGRPDAPPSPFVDCGFDNTEDELDCRGGGQSACHAETPCSATQ